jgi:ABC-2 type transport system permease protein
MSKNNLVMPEKELQEQKAVVVNSGGASNQNTLRNIGLIVGREYKNRVSQRSFIISTIIILVLLAVGACVPTIIQYFTSHSNSQTHISVVNKAGSIGGLNSDTLTSYINTALNGKTGTTTGQRSYTKAQFVFQMASAGNINSLKNQVKNGTLPFLLVLDRTLNQDLRFTSYTNSSPTDDVHASQVQALVSQLNVLDTSARQGLTPAQTSSLFAQPQFSEVNLNQAQNSRSTSEIVAGYVLAYAGNILIYMAVLLYGMGVATGVAEEKGTRIMEILVNVATPFQLLVGKIIGIGAAGLTQMALIVMVGIGALLLQFPLQAALLGSTTGILNLNITGASITMLVMLLVYFILGFLLFATLFAAMGALVKRQDEVQNAVAPLTMLLAVGYIVSFFGVYIPDATWVKVISYVPFWTPTTMLTRIGASGVAPWEVAMTIALMVVSIFVCALLSARIYRFGILIYGQRPGLRQLAKLIRAE